MALPVRLSASVLATAMLLGGCADDRGGTADEDGTPPTTTTGSDTDGSVDIGGRSLHYECEGSAVAGEPTIVLISGANLGVDSWSPIPEDLATAGHHVCGIDRAGYGVSDPAPEPRRTSSDTADDLLAAIDALGLAPPYVLVAHSAGALEAVLISARIPDRIAGAVLVDPAGPHVDDVARAALPPEEPGESPVLADEREFLTVVDFQPSDDEEHLVIEPSLREAAAALDAPGRLFGDAPVVVLQAPPPPYWEDLPPAYVRAVGAAADADNRQLAAESTDGTVVRVRHTSHMIMDDRPELLLATIEDVLAR